MNRKIIASAVVLVAGVLGGSLIMTVEPMVVADTHDHGHDHGHEEEGEEFERGPHSGRMLRSGAAAVEMTIFEDGVPPEFHVYPFLNDKPVAPDTVTLSVELSRLGGVVDSINFAAAGDYLRGDQTVHEPHSFDVKVRATVGGASHTWSYASYEGRVEISAAAAAAAGIEIETAGPAEITEVVRAPGRIILDGTRTARVQARFPGVLRELRKGLGDRVTKGETIAVIESSESLQPYPVVAPITGTVIDRNAVVGEIVEDDPIIEVADLDRVIAELWAFPRDAAVLKAGQPARITAVGADISAAGQLDLILPVAESASQALPIRVSLANPDGAWRPGMAVEGAITFGARTAPLAVKVSGLQQFRDFTVVYTKVDETYEVRMLDLGISDGTFVEVLGGLDPGTTYVTGNSYLIKADIEKSGASHDH